METQSSNAQEWLDRFFATYYRQHPVNATFIGVHEFDHLLPDASEETLSDMLNHARSMLTEIAWADISDIDPVTRTDLDLARGHLEIQQWELLSRHFQRGNPSWYTGEAIFGVMSLFLREFAPLEARIPPAISRMRAIPEFLVQARDNVGASHPHWVARAIRECDGSIAFMRQGVRYISDDPEFLDAAGSAAEAFEEHRRYLESDDAVDPAFDVAAGEDAFDRLMRRGHFLDMQASDILSYAEAQAEEAEARLQEHAPEFGSHDWRKVLPQLQDYHPDINSYYGEYQRVWEACRALAIERDLISWPDYPIRYVPRPEWSRAAAPYLYFLFYRSPSPFDDVPTVDYLVTPIEPDMPEDVQLQLLRGHNDSVIKLNHVVHHGSVGHHIQNWHAFRAESRIGRMAAVDCASRIAMFCGGTMAEGWSSYTTDLMAEHGFLTPLEEFSLHHARLRMACRAVVDVRLHTGELTIDDAAELYQTRVGMAQDAALDEAVKNSMFPGAAMIYLIGTDMILNLRTEVSDTMGDEFSLRAFHDEFLSYGSIPVSIISRKMKESMPHAE